MPVIIYEDAAVANLEPLALTRAAFDLRCGAGTLLERQLHFFGVREAGAIVRPALASLCRRAHPELSVNEPAVPADGPLTLVNARWLPPVSRTMTSGPPEVGLVGDEVAYVRRPADRTRLESGEVERLVEEAKLAQSHRAAGG